jgi:flagellar motor switch protein FliM
MSKYDALFEDQDDIFNGTPVSKYWDIVDQISKDLMKDEFDALVERVAAMEAMLSETHNYEDLDRTIQNYCIANMDKMDNLKKSVYMELAGKLIYRVSD